MYGTGYTILTVADEGMEPVRAHVHEQVHCEEHGEGRAGLRQRSMGHSKIMLSHGKHGSTVERHSSSHSHSLTDGDRSGLRWESGIWLWNNGEN
jgi:hypothetical protein